MPGVTRNEVYATWPAICAATDRARADDRRSTTPRQRRQPAFEVARRACAQPRNLNDARRHEHHRPHRRDRPSGPVMIRRRPRNGRGRLSACVAVAIALLSAGLLAGCGGGAHTSSPTKVLSGALAYANCMRSHGVPDFPDPNSQGEFRIQPVRVHNGVQTVSQDLQPSSPASQAAQRVCGPFGSAGRQVTAVQEKQEFRLTLEAAECMRANGVPNYPTPNGSTDRLTRTTTPASTSTRAHRRTEGGEEVRTRAAANWDSRRLTPSSAGKWEGPPPSRPRARVLLTSRSAPRRPAYHHGAAINGRHGNATASATIHKPGSRPVGMRVDDRVRQIRERGSDAIAASWPAAQTVWDLCFSSGRPARLACAFA
jgi:hypothetical protein